MREENQGIGGCGLRLEKKQKAAGKNSCPGLPERLFQSLLRSLILPSCSFRLVPALVCSRRL